MGKTKGGNPHPGRYIHVWAEEAGLDRANIKKSAGSWCFSSPEERQIDGGEGAIFGLGEGGCRGRVCNKGGIGENF